MDPSLKVGATDSVTVTAFNLSSSSTYSITVTTSDGKLGFNSDCSDRSESVSSLTGSTSHSRTFTLYACQASSGRVTATLSGGASASTQQDVTITKPLPASAVCSEGNLISNPTAAANVGLVSDCTILLDTIGTLRGTSTETLAWSADANSITTRWDGVTVEDIDPGHGVMHRVTGLDLSGKELNGTIPAALGNLPKLQTLNLSNNDLTNGPVAAFPTNMDLGSIVTLDLSNNNLSGAIPSNLASLSNLTTLKLSGNQFTGSIPSSLSTLTSLTTLDLSNNLLTGGIPDFLGDLANTYRLRTLKLSGNPLQGCSTDTLNKKLASLTTSDLSRIPCYAAPIVQTDNTCSALFVRPKSEASDNHTLTAADGSTHYIHVEITASRPPLDDRYCTQAKMRVEATPGAGFIDWSTNIYGGSLIYFASTPTQIGAMSLTEFNQSLVTWQGIGQGDHKPAQEDCTNCRGGTIVTEPVYGSRGYYKQHRFDLTGFYRYRIGAVTHVHGETLRWTTEHKGVLINIGENPALKKAGLQFGEIVGHVITTLVDEALERVRGWIADAVGLPYP